MHGLDCHGTSSARCQLNKATTKHTDNHDDVDDDNEDNSQGNGLLLLWENCGFSDSPTQIREYYQQILERVLGIIIESLWSRNVRRNYLK